jgi:hypothetical protein
MTVNKQVPTAMKQHATTEELLGAVFSVVPAMTVATQWRSKHASAATVELHQQKSSVFYMVRAEGLSVR